MRTWRTGPESEKLPDQEAHESFPPGALEDLGRGMTHSNEPS